MIRCIQNGAERASCNVEEELTWMQQNYAETTMRVRIGAGLLEGVLRGKDLRIRMTLGRQGKSGGGFTAMGSTTFTCVEEPQPVQLEEMDWDEGESICSSETSTTASSTMTTRITLKEGSCCTFKNVKNGALLTVELLEHRGMLSPFRVLGSVDLAMRDLPREIFAPPGNDKRTTNVARRLVLGSHGVIGVVMRFETKSLLQTKAEWDSAVADGPP